MADVNDLLARLKMPASNGSTSQETIGNNPFSALQHPQPHPSNSPTPFASIASPPPTTFTPGLERAASDRTANLLNLLKFNSAPSPASFGQPDAFHARSASGPGSQIKSPPPSSLGNPQEALLKLLNQSQPASFRTASAGLPFKSNEGQSCSDGAAFGKQSQANAESFARVAKTPVFNHVNPFDELAASAPTIRERQPASILATTTPQENILMHPVGGANEKQLSRGATSPADGRNEREALPGTLPQNETGETVTQALQEAGQQADEQASAALAHASATAANLSHSNSSEVQQAMQQAAIEIKDRLKNGDTKEFLEATMPSSMARGFEETIRKVADGELAESWESADSGQEYDTRIYGFPMRPFVSIDVLPHEGVVPRVRDDIVMKIASLKREFDQVDRTLAAATTNHIVYAMSKGGGFRVIRQDDGSNKHVFKKTGNQIFNIGIRTSSKEQAHEPVLATGLNGSIYWTGIPVATTANFNDANMDKLGFQFPPMASQDDNTSGGQLKTRAKLSSRHPEYFAVGRGKSIHIIWPQIAMQADYCDQTTRIVDSEKYLAERGLKIATGKAGKDFAFSEDDSVLVSLDKAGRLKFWDIKDHTDPQISSGNRVRQVDTRVPLMVLATSSPEKSWATSVQFLDKERPTSKGSALRYLLVGSKQNHTIHLWDLALAKPVQEINFPHENETDPLCSITYHARSGIVVIGHPTRNSIYLIQLSAPRYNLSHMSQASYVERLARKDPTLPKPETTAILSSMREISLSSIGALRSLELSTAVSNEENILEVYIMHSRGVTCLNFKRQDAGVGEDGKPLDSAMAEDTGLIKVSELRTASTTEPSDPSESGHKAQQSTPSAAGPPVVAPVTVTAKPAATSKDAPLSKAPIGLRSNSEQPVSEKPPKPMAVNATEPTELASGSSASVAQRVTSQVPSVKTPNAQPLPGTTQFEATASFSRAEERAASTARSFPVDQLSSSLNEETTDLLSAKLGAAISSSMGGVLSDVLTSVLSEQFEKLYRRIDEDKRVQEAAGAAKQDAVLRLVSSTLTDNVEKSLAQIVTKSIQQDVVPPLKDAVVQSIDTKVTEALAAQIQATVSREMKAVLGAAIGRAMQEPEVLRIVSDRVTSKISTHVEDVFAASLRNSIAPSFQNLAVESAKRMTGEISARVQDQLHGFEMKQNYESDKIDQLTAHTSELLQTVRTMAGVQSELQSELLQLRTELSQYQQQAAAVAMAQPRQPSRPTFQDAELEAVADLISRGRREEAIIKWLQSANQVEMFDEIFVRVDPSYLRDTNQIVTLSVCAAVTATLETNLAERLAWLKVALDCLDAHNPEIAEHAAGVMDALTQRLQDAFMSIAEISPSNASLPMVRRLVLNAKEFKKVLG